MQLDHPSLMDGAKIPKLLENKALQLERLPKVGRPQLKF